MKITIPDSTKDITLQQMQEIGRSPNKPLAFFEKVLKIDKPTEIFRMEEIKATYATFEHMLYLDINLHKDKLPEMGSKVIDGYYLPPHILDIRVKHFIEIVNADISEDNYDGLEIYAGCFYRKDWEKKYSQTELIETMNHFLKKPFYYSAITPFLMRHLMETHRMAFPLLSTRDVEDPVQEKEEGRKLYDMLNGLSKDDPTKWHKAESLKLHTAFAYLEVKKKKMIEDRLAQAQR